MCSPNPAYYIGNIGTEEYNATLAKLTSYVADANKGYTTESSCMWYVKTVNYKATGKVGLFFGQRYLTERARKKYAKELAAIVAAQ